jgi:hypothetical protein
MERLRLIVSLAAIANAPDVLGLVQTVAGNTFGAKEGATKKLHVPAIEYEGFQAPQPGGALDRAHGTYIFPKTVPFGEKTAHQSKSETLANKNNEISDYMRVYPEVCLKPSPIHPNFTNPAPGSESKRIALVLRGDSMRGLSMGVTVGYKGTDGKDRNDKLPFYCTAHARAIQVWLLLPLVHCVTMHQHCEFFF